MTTTDQHAGFIAAIRADPDDDTLRLIYADYLDETGQAERGEFIRVQVELAGLPARIACEGMGRPKCDFCGSETDLDGVCRSTIPNPNRRFPALCRRERELLEAHGTEWAKPIATVFDFHCGKGQWNYKSGWRASHSGATDQTLWEFGRGFIEQLTLPSALWLAHADAILAAAPVREVTLTTWPECGIDDFRMLRRPANTPVKESSPIRRATRNETVQDSVRWLLAAEWPGIKFTLPDHGPSPLRAGYAPWRAFQDWANRH